MGTFLTWLLAFVLAMCGLSWALVAFANNGQTDELSQKMALWPPALLLAIALALVIRLVTR